MSIHQVTGSVELPPKFLRILKEDDQGVITVEEKLFFFLFQSKNKTTSGNEKTQIKYKKDDFFKVNAKPFKHRYR